MAGAFGGEENGPCAPPGRYKKRKKSTLLTRTQRQLWVTFRVGTGNSVVAGVGIAVDGSRAKYGVGIWSRSSRTGGLDTSLY